MVYGSIPPVYELMLTFAPWLATGTVIPAYIRSTCGGDPGGLPTTWWLMKSSSDEAPLSPLT